MGILVLVCFLVGLFVVMMFTEGGRSCLGGIIGLGLVVGFLIILGAAVLFGGAYLLAGLGR